VPRSVETLSLRAGLRVLFLGAKFGNAHISSSISCVDILVACFLARESNLDKEVILSKGHAAVAWYATLSELELISHETLLSFAKNHSHLGVHLTKNATTRSSLSTGSLGHGLSFGAGVAFGAKLLQSDRRPIVVIGDGELGEGSVWEAAQFAGRFSLGNLTAIVDLNGVQAVGQYAEVFANQEVGARFTSHGWTVIEIDETSSIKLYDTLKSIQSSIRPVAILANSWDSPHFSFFRKSVEWHYRSPTFEEIEGSLPDALSKTDYDEIRHIFS